MTADPSSSSHAGEDYVRLSNHTLWSFTGQIITRSPMFNQYALSRLVKQLGLPSSLWVAYSGGLDSHVLLHGLAQLRAEYPELRITAIHIHHGLSPHADNWSKHCQQVCEDLNVTCLIKYIDPTSYTSQANLEEVARNSRYKLLAELLPVDACLLTAHHLDDQAETILLRLLRGAGVQGLAAVPQQRSLGKGRLVRPLLQVPRHELVAYAQREKLIWVEDESNACIHFDRNYLRQEVLPGLVTRWPAAVAALGRAASHCRESVELLAEVAAVDLGQTQGREPDMLVIAKLVAFSCSRQKNLVRHWLGGLGFSAPSQVVLQQLLQGYLQAKEDAKPLVVWGNAEIRRFNGNLYAMSSLVPHDPSVSLLWDMQRPLLLPADIGQLVADITATEGVHVPVGATITVRFRQGGERFHPAGRQGSHPLKKLFQEWQVVPWLRDRIPLIYFDNRLAVVVGYAVGQIYTAPVHRLVKVRLVECKL